MSLSLVSRPSPNFDERAGGVGPSFIILHYTGMPDAQAALARLTDPGSKVSAHYTIDEDGTVYRHVAEEKRAWHAGRAYWMGATDINSHSIGIELVNPGHEWGYRAFPQAQIQSLTALCKDITSRIEMDKKSVLAHADIAPARKTDPGELFPWERLAKSGIGAWPRPSDDDVVRGAGLMMARALSDFGYDPREAFEANLLAFQRHFVPEAFSEGRAGEVTGLTRTRLYALLAGHLHV
ncbi:MAG: N-acetylmuramoyl-L-alanine amidase [Rhodospirillales bacterium]|nr:N-acetylmuramoyl-L-alanine amidase [Alphaproteobacteria bacterium]USO04529.1 MAG: N-acetylmuramoyl-L-alanine amidase [Rhodospirillales bacterium]